MPVHFGINVRAGKYGLRLSRDKYGMINNRSSFEILMGGLDAEGAYEDRFERVYTDEWCEKHRRDCLKNFDNNIEFFSTLDKVEFNRIITAFLNNNSEFRQVDNLYDYSNVSGCYLMVLDDYCQVYFGVSDDIEKRIRQHWSGTKPFDRLLLPIGAVSSSKLPIDVFRAMDTTRLFACAMPDSFKKEDEYLRQIPSKFTLNRMQGGEIVHERGGIEKDDFVEVLSRIKEHDISGSLQ